MADYYALEFVGGPDGTSNPPKKLDPRLVGAKERSVRAVKPSTILNPGDRLYIGKNPMGAVIHSITAISDTSFGGTTLSIGTTAVPTKYVNAKTMTNTDVLTALGPKASAFVAAPVSANEDLWVTIGVEAIPAAVIAAFAFAYKIST